MTSSKRNALILIGISLVAGYLFYRADSFWGVAVMFLVTVGSLVFLLPFMDPFWRFKTGFVTSIFFLAVIVLVPSATHVIPSSKFQNNWLTRYVVDHIAQNGHFAIAPGLDLKGGLRLVYTVGVDEAISDKRNNIAEEMRQELGSMFDMRKGDRLTREEATQLDQKVHVSTPEQATIRIKFADPADVAKIDDRFQKKFLQELAMQKGPGANEVTFKIRAEVESQIRERAVSQAKDTVSRRIDEKGLKEANVIARDEDIIIEMPGQDEGAFQEIKEIIARTARLEFKMVDDDNDFMGRIKDTDLPESEGIAIYTEQAPDGIGPDGKPKSIVTHYARMALKPDKYPNETMEECRARFKKWVDTLQVPDDHQIGFEPVTTYDPDTQASTEEGWRTLFLWRRADVTGDYITDAVAQPPNQSTGGLGSYYVALTFSPAGADRFEEVTGANVKRRFAIILDDVVDSAPVIQSKIPGGHATITMGAGDPEQQLQQARKLEIVLRSGALPAPISPSTETRIGASLGKDAIGQGGKGALVGAALVLVFMIFYYRKSGLVADAAVAFNLILQLAILAAFEATMTLPGIAGLALTVGMAVDANVLINERIREELRAGRTPRAAVEAGYGKALSSIIDGHVTVAISGLILMQYGTGPIKGFAVALLVGITASLFTGVFCTRLVFDWWTRGARVKSLSVGAEF
jgi:preprotein translocase subunit SecD